MFGKISLFYNHYLANFGLYEDVHLPSPCARTDDWLLMLGFVCCDKFVDFERE